VKPRTFPAERVPNEQAFCRACGWPIARGRCTYCRREGGLSHHDPTAIAEGIKARESGPRPDNLAGLLEDVRNAFCRYIGFASQGQSVALTLWTAHTHVQGAADCTPYVWIHSAEKESGKTRTEEVAFHLVRDGVRASSVSASAIFRLIDARHPTLLVDEVDAIFAPKSEQEDLRSILNAGYERGNPVYRSVAVGKAWDATPFDAFCPKMLAGIENGRLPDTLASRSIPIRLQRKRKGEPSVSKFRKRSDPPRLQALRTALASWATEETVRSPSGRLPRTRTRPHGPPGRHLGALAHHCR
jgi:hypothetical protein